MKLDTNVTPEEARAIGNGRGPRTPWAKAVCEEFLASGARMAKVTPDDGRNPYYVYMTLRAYAKRTNLAMNVVSRQGVTYLVASQGKKHTQ